MAYQKTLAMIIMTLLFVITVIGNFLLAIMIIKLKRQEEHKRAEKKRHFDVLFTALAVGDTLGSCVNYPMLLHFYRTASQEKEISGSFCEILGSSAVFYFSFIATLTVTMNLHQLFSGIWPFKYYSYLRRKNSKIPLLCVGVSLSVALISLVMTANGFPLFNLTLDNYFDVRTCVPISSDIPSRYYYFLVAHLCFWTHLFVFVVTLRIIIKTRKTQIAKFGRLTGKIGWFGLPVYAWFQLVFKLVYLIFWSPFMVAMTIVTCSTYSIPTDVLVTVCYLMFVPGLLGPLAYYVTHQDLRDVFNATIRNILSRISMQGHGSYNDRENVEDIGMKNPNSINESLQ